MNTDAIVCDPFAGTCTVARHLKAAGYGVVTGDRLHASAVLQHAYVGLDAAPEFSRLVKRVMSEPCEDNPGFSGHYLSEQLGWDLGVHHTYLFVRWSRAPFILHSRERAKN